MPRSRHRRVRLSLLACAVVAAGACGGRGDASLDTGWVGSPWATSRAKAVDDSTLARAGGTGGAVVSPIEASTERLAARTRAHPAAPRATKAEKSASSVGKMRVAVVRTALDRLKYAEARNFRLRRTYSGDPAQLEYEALPGTMVRVVWANKWGWAALAADSAVPDHYCAMFVGSVPDAITPEAKHWGKPGQSYCDGQTDGEPIGRPVLYGNETPDQTLLRYAMTMMPTNLMQLAISQDAYRRVQGTYARRIEPMALQYGWQPGVRVRMLFANSEGWSAEAVYDLVPGRSCVIWGGTVPQHPATAADARTADQEGVPVCDD